MDNQRSPQMPAQTPQNSGRAMPQVPQMQAGMQPSSAPGKPDPQASPAHLNPARANPQSAIPNQENAPLRAQPHVPAPPLIPPMQLQKAQRAGALEKERKREFNRERSRGFVIRCDGEFAVIASEVGEASYGEDNFWAVGQLVSIQVGKNRVVGMVSHVHLPAKQWDLNAANTIEVTVELVGETEIDQAGNATSFSRGIANYPTIGCVTHRIRGADLARIYDSDNIGMTQVGHLTQDPDVEAKISIDSLLSRHFAVLGTTGVGKSSAVSLILRKVIKIRKDIRVLLLDPHNEFGGAFGSHALTIDANNLILPFWLFRLDEFCDALFRGQSGFDEEKDVLREIIPMAKEVFRDELNKGKQSGLARKSAGRTNFTADTPVPYRILDLISVLDDRLGQLEGRAEKPMLRTLRNRLESISRDPMFRFMFEKQGSDVFESALSEIFRIPHNDKPICVLEMSGLPSDVVNSVVSVLCRLAFDLATNSSGGIQTLVVCEEAHRYIPADGKAGFLPTRQAIARIAKEGRKYGVYLGIVTQRPCELDPTILSQCNTLFAMRLGNERDQEIIRRAAANGAKSTIGFLPSIANRECIAFGEAIHTPMRLTFETIPPQELPGAQIYAQQARVKEGLDISLRAVARRIRQEDRRGEVYDDSGSIENVNTASKDRFAGSQFAESEVSAQPGDDLHSIMNAVYQPQAAKTAATPANNGFAQNAAPVASLQNADANTAATIHDGADLASEGPASLKASVDANLQNAAKSSGMNLLKRFRQKS